MIKSDGAKSLATFESVDGRVHARCPRNPQRSAPDSCDHERLVWSKAAAGRIDFVTIKLNAADVVVGALGATGDGG